MNEQTKAAMQMALEALETVRVYGSHRHPEAITALHEALAQNPMDYDQGFVDGVEDGLAMAEPQVVCSKMETTTTQGEWVDLTDDEIWDVFAETDDLFLSEARAVISKFKSKNTPPVVPQGEHVGWLWRMHGWVVTAHSKHRGIKTYIDLCRPPNSVIESDDFIELLPVYTASPSVEAAIADAYDKGCADGIDIVKAQVEAAIKAERYKCEKEGLVQAIENIDQSIAVEAAIEATIDKVLACYSPDDTAQDWADKIKGLK